MVEALGAQMQIRWLRSQHAPHSELLYLGLRVCLGLVDRLVCPVRRVAFALVWGAVHLTTVRRAAQGAYSLKAQGRPYSRLLERSGSRALATRVR